MPCKNLAHLDKRYRERYDMSMIENLKSINAKGMDGFLAEQATKCQCPICGGVVSVHDEKCYSCGNVRKKTEFKPA
jgi:rubrerythrin